MQAIRQTFDDAPDSIPVPISFQHKRLEVILLLQEDAEAIRASAAPAIGAGCEEAFYLLAGLSDDFMAEGREQPPLQERDGF